MEKTSRGNRLHIGFYGRVNVGKSTLINKIVNQEVSIVSEQKGTTTDVVYKTMELLPIGPVVLMDTAGVDDNTSLGKKRIKKTAETLDKADIAVIICDYNGWSEAEEEIARKAKDINTPILAVITKNDVKKVSTTNLDKVKKFTKNIIITNQNDNKLITEFKNLLIEILPEDYIKDETVTGNLVREKDIVILVIPIDKEAPKGRLILPQVQMIRELLDKNAKVVIVKENELKEVIEELNTQPKLVITDSQAFKKVSEIVPKNIMLTSFSILLANSKGDINIFLNGAKSIDRLQVNDKILFFESCTHHAIDDDIARVKIPKMLEKKTDKKFRYEYHSGCAMPENINEYSLIIHCGACMTNKKEVLTRINKAQSLNIPITNYGVVIAYCLGIAERAVLPLKLYK
ncbi:[bacterium]|nr:[FeFe] hydrogenase H-cluster maturation GTPase HydF [bacterium]